MNQSKMHLSIHTSQLNEMVSFYTQFFGAKPVKHYADYAKFDIDQPGLNLAILGDSPVNRSGRGAVNHFGIQVAEKAHVEAMIDRAKAMGLPHDIESETTCCYGVQNKVWIKDPEGNAWEIFQILVADTGGTGAACSTDGQGGMTCTPEFKN